MSKYKSVLLVEDDPITIMVCERIIMMTDFADRVTSCENGQIAIDFLKNTIGKNGDAPEIIFLDINMPVKNGWDFLEEMEELRHGMPGIPQIYILSSTVDPEDYKKARRFPAVVDFISKPLSKEYLDAIRARR